MHRNLLLPVRFRTITDAMGMCESVGDIGDFLRPFSDLNDFARFHKEFLNNKAIQKYCSHGERYLMWLPLTGRNVQVTYLTTFFRK